MKEQLKIVWKFWEFETTFKIQESEIQPEFEISDNRKPVQFIKS
jgi:hypothetical protein